MEYEKIERFVSDILTISAVSREGCQQAVGQALYHLLMAAGIYEVMDSEEREVVGELTKRLQFFFRTKFSLKERNRKKRKEKFPPNPLLKEKENKEKDEKTISLVPDGDCSLQRHSKLSATLAARREAFRQEVLSRRGTFSDQLLGDFYYYWSEANEATGKMRFEEQRHWSLDNRLRRWSKNQYSADNVAAALRMKRLEKQQAKAQAEAEQQRLAAEDREQQEARREAEQQKSRERQMLTDEYIREHPDGILAQVRRERMKKEEGRGRKDDVCGKKDDG